MTTHSRSPGQTAISVSVPKTLLDEIDQRAQALGLSRSQYLTQLARQDLAAKGSLILQEKTTTYGISSERKAELDAKVDEFVLGTIQDQEKKRKKSKRPKV